MRSVTLLAFALVACGGPSGERGASPPKPESPPEPKPPPANVDVDDQPDPPREFDTSQLSDDVEPCVGRDGKYVRCVARVVTGHRPKSLAFSPGGEELWVALHYDRPALAVYDARSFELIDAVELGEYGAVELHFSADGSRLYASQFETASVFEIDRAERTVARTFATGSTASKVIELAADGKTMWVANWDGQNVSEFDLESGSLRRQLETPGIPRGLYATPDGTWLYVAGYEPGRLYRFALETGEVAIAAESGDNLRHLVGDWERRRLYASDLGGASIYVHEMDGGFGAEKLTASDNKPNTIDLSPDGRVLYVSNRGANNPESYMEPGPEWGTILAMEAETGRRLDAVVTGKQSTGLDVSPNGRLLATTDFQDNRINVYELPTTDVLLRSKGGRSQSYRDHIAKPEGDWGTKAEHDPTFWHELFPPDADQEDGEPEDQESGESE